MSDVEVIQRQLAGVTSARSETALFVKMDGPLAVVNIGAATIPVRCVGFYPPVAGMPVRVDWVNGVPSLTGPMRPLSPVGKITATGSPRATVTVDGVAYSLFYRSGYTPAVNDDVEINWATGIIQGKITGVTATEAPPESVAVPETFEFVVRAEDSGRFNSGGRWGNSDPWASNSTRGLWTYGDRIKDALAGVVSVNFVDVFLPLVSELGNASIGVHEYGALPGFFPTIIDPLPLPLGTRAGWLRMPNWGAFLALGQRGVGVLAPGGGQTIWNGIATDPMSGALRFNVTR
ncbi:hypothetical protein D8M34_06575 [Microbacterium sp. HSID17254]|uniref:hypothetical protein n=1 Tax=Microbacterium sp. HSID17254 TaxID=2419509 RepID=UPI000F8778FD|nr:hypothetical protein [Microbacterium sp. HSID17254]RUQ06680.1 hypothetical protein D8M34_06575 [Microbacterium sp. HSID17254]